MTTRYAERHFPGAFFGTLHETGHGLYEQGLAPDAFGLAAGTYCSLGIHESQSRLWENLVGRSRSFWKWAWPRVEKAFPDALRGVSADRFFQAVNTVESSFIRVEADEVTYNLHIMLRFELERALLSGDLEPGDVPTAWNEAFARDFGLDVGSPSDGCLQDIHWSAGLIGYFATYTLGNIYAAQFFAAAERELGDLGAQFAGGEFAPLLNWLRDNVHARGRTLPAPELVETVCGEPPSSERLIGYLTDKFRGVYGLE